MGDRTDAPLIAITPDVCEPQPGRVRLQCALGYAACVAEAGGVPVIVPPLPEQIDRQVGMVDGLVLTGGGDPRMEAFGATTDPRASLMHLLRQEYETALVRRLMERPEVPVLGICLGMQMMALMAGGRLDQHLPDRLATADRHQGDRRHGIVPEHGGGGAAGWLVSGEVTSHHRQGITDAGRLRVIARSDDGVIEAVEHPSAAFWVGVQWHPERTEDPRLGRDLFVRLVEASRARRARRPA